MRDIATPRRWPERALLLMLLAAFGPYIAPGIRTEQAAVYGLLGLGVLGMWWRRGRIDAPTSALVFLMAAQFAIAAIGAAAPLVNLTRYGSLSALAGLDNLALPAAALVATTWIAWSGDPQQLLRKACAVLVVAGCANTAIAGWSLTHDVAEALGMFWGSGSDGPSTAENALTMGRYSGLFNHPAEGGLFYSLALLAAIYRLRDRPAILAITAAVITTGGCLTVSKVFLLAGLPIALWSFTRTTGRRTQRFAWLGAAAAAAWLAGLAGWLPHWQGSGALMQFLDPASNGRGGLNLYTAGRFGQDSTLTPVIDEVVRFSPWFGFGAQGLNVAYDSGYIEALVTTGLVGLALHCLILVTLAAAWFKTRHAVDPTQSRLFGGLVLLLVGGSTGIPALTANRTATLVWCLIALLLVGAARSGRRDGGHLSAAVRLDHTSDVLDEEVSLGPGASTARSGGVA